MRPVAGVTLDAFGTILELEPPVPKLVRELRERWGSVVSEAEAGAALAAEITYYKAHHLEGRDRASLGELRLRCAGVLRDRLPDRWSGRRPEPEELVPAMLRSLRFRPFPDAVPALGWLRSRGIATAVVSNWDVSLPDAIGDCGLAGLIDHVVSSAGVGADKPSPQPFERAVELLELPPSALVHIGDEPDLDIAGARAAGIAPILIHRPGGSPPEPDARVPVIRSLRDLRLMI